MTDVSQASAGSLGLVERVAALHRVELFAGIPGRVLAAVAEVGVEKRLSAGEVLMEEGANPGQDLVRSVRRSWHIERRVARGVRALQEALHDVVTRGHADVHVAARDEVGLEEALHAPDAEAVQRIDGDNAGSTVRIRRRTYEDGGLVGSAS